MNDAIPYPFGQNPPVGGGRQKTTPPFDLGDWQVIIAGTMGHDVATLQICDILRPQLDDQRSALILAANRMVPGFSAKRLLDKIEALSGAQNLEMQMKTCALHAETTMQELFGSGWWPDPSILRVAGLVKPVSEPVWGFCSIRLDDDRCFAEVILRHERKVETLENCSATELAEMCVRLVRANKNSSEPGDEIWLRSICYALVAATGFRHVVVAQTQGAVSVEEIRPQALRADIANGDYEGLSFAGVNAPKVRARQLQARS